MTNRAGPDRGRKWVPSSTESLPGTTSPSTAGLPFMVTEDAVAPHNGKATTAAAMLAGIDNQLVPLHEKPAAINLPPEMAF